MDLIQSRMYKMNKVDILSNIDNPAELERLYRENKSAFAAEFNAIYPELKDHQLAAFWYERLNYENADISWGSTTELIFVILAALFAGVIAKIPAIFNIDPEYFYLRNAGFVVFPVLTTYFIWKKNLSVTKMIVASVATVMSAIFINLLPDAKDSDTLFLSCIHLPIFLWAVFGFSFIGDDIKDHQKRLDFLRFNGDLLILTTLILIAGGILTGITIGLFSVIDIQIESFYFDNIAIFGLAAAPVVAAYITQTNPQLVSKISPLIAKIFSPLVLITLVVYLVAIVISGKDPYNDREFLMLFNFLLIGVMAIILFSVVTSKKNENRSGSYILFALSIVTIIVNGIALSAILFRISEWGFTPNRLAVLGANMLMLINLFFIAYRLFKHISKKSDISEVEKSISVFLPVYIAWTIIVAFVFPLIFQFR